MGDHPPGCSRFAGFQVSVRPIDPNWPSAGEWLAGERAAKTIGTLTVLGAPVALGAISGARCDLAPQAIRAALARYSTYDVEFGRDLRALAIHDCGDLKIADLSPEQALAPIRDAVSKAVAHSAAVVILGGDNSITYPAAKPATGLLTFDAHFDLQAMDNGLTNGNPIRALLADGFPGGQIVQVGIQSFANSRAYADIARQAGITFITLEQIRLRGIENVTAEALTQLSNSADFIYVDFDLDVLDRTFAPATPGSRPGGLAPWELRRAARLCGLHPRVRAIDLVEIDPTRDVADTTSLAAAACMLSFASGLHQRLRG